MLGTEQNGNINDKLLYCNYKGELRNTSRFNCSLWCEYKSMYRSMVGMCFYICQEWLGM